MLRIGKLTDYSLVLLTHFARAPQQTLNARDLAKESRLPLPTVSKILKHLARNALLESLRGAAGGYRLTVKPETITVAQVIEAFEGPIAMTECSARQPGVCEFETDCPLTGNWQKITNVVARALNGLTLSDMNHPLPEKEISKYGI